MTGLLVVLGYLGYIVLSTCMLWPLAAWAGQRLHPAVLALALVTTLAAIGLVIYAFAGTLPLHQRQPWQNTLAHALGPLLGLLLLLPFTLCIAIAQTCVRLISRPGIASGISYGLGICMAVLSPLALLGSAQGLTGVGL